MIKEIIVLSDCDGISCGQEALNQMGFNVKDYYASEKESSPIKVTMKRHPDTKQLGDMTSYNIADLGWIDLYFAGTPCQGFSKAGNQLNFEHEQSKLFFVYVEHLKIIRKINPDVKFLLENVNMKKEWQDIITSYLGVEPIRINSNLVSAQRRDRLYWTNIEGISQPEDRDIKLTDILQSGEVDRDKSYCLDANYFKGTNAKQYISKARRQIVWVIPEATKKGYVEVSEGNCIDLTFIKSKTRRGRLMLEKSNCLTATMGKYCKVTNDWFRMLTPIECERLQTLPDNYTEGISNSARYKALGNGWTVEVIKHIFSFLPLEWRNE